MSSLFQNPAWHLFIERSTRPCHRQATPRTTRPAILGSYFLHFSREQRIHTLSRLKQTVFDIAIIGGGINGASIARDAAMRGYSVALVERNDFGFGTSSRSSRLIHGGVRYLEQGEVGLCIRECQRTREISATCSALGSTAALYFSGLPRRRATV